MRFTSIAPGYGVAVAWLLECFIMVMRHLRFAVRMGRHCQWAASLFHLRHNEIIRFLNILLGYGVGFAWLWECVLAAMRRERLATVRGVQFHPKCIQSDSDLLNSKNTLVLCLLRSGMLYTNATAKLDSNLLSNTSCI